MPCSLFVVGNCLETKQTVFGYLEAGRVTPGLAWHGYRGWHCLCLRLAGTSVTNRRGRGEGGNLGSQAVS